MFNKTVIYFEQLYLLDNRQTMAIPHCPFIMENAKITRDDLTDVKVKIESILNEDNVAAGCYSIYIGDDYEDHVCL